jgi:hypothetical protein
MISLFRFDNHLYETLKHMFPNMNLRVLELEELKSEQAKTIWREFITKFEKHIQDFNFGTLIRLDCALPYTEENSTLGERGIPIYDSTLNEPSLRTDFISNLPL